MAFFSLFCCTSSPSSCPVPFSFADRELPSHLYHRGATEQRNARQELQIHLPWSDTLQRVDLYLAVDDAALYIGTARELRASSWLDPRVPECDLHSPL